MDDSLGRKYCVKEVERVGGEKLRAFYSPAKGMLSLHWRNARFSGLHNLMSLGVIGIRLLVGWK